MKNRFLLYLLLLLVSTNILAQSQKEITTIAIYGDTKTNYKIHQKVVDQILTYHPQLVIHTGDEVKVGFMQNQWNRFDSITKNLRKTSLFFPVPGNHEMESGKYYSNFNLPEPKTWYYYQNGSLLILFFNTNVDYGIGSAQYNYFLNVLEEKGKSAKYILAVTHHPPYNTAAHQSKTKNLKTHLVPLFNKFHVSAIFSGHVHAFEHSLVDSIHYVVSGGGGAGLHPQKRKAPESKMYYYGYNFCILEVSAEKIKVNVYNEANLPIYSFDIMSRD